MGRGGPQYRKAVGTGRELYPDFTVRRSVGESHRLGGAELRNRVRGGDLPDQTLDLSITQRLTGNGTERSIIHERRWLADGELERFCPLFLHHLYQSVESCHDCISVERADQAYLGLVDVLHNPVGGQGKKSTGRIDVIESPGPVGWKLERAAAPVLHPVRQLD